MVSLRPIHSSEIAGLKQFPPKDWNIDLPQVFSFHVGHAYFYPAVAAWNKTIVGCGMAMVYGTVGWLGTIIVLPEYRKQGIGEAITRHLMDHCLARGCSSLALVASEMGEPLYTKLGFRTNGTYVFYSREREVPFLCSTAIRALRPEDIPAVQTLDREATGEERFTLIERFLSTASVYVSPDSGNIDGVYITDFGHGLVLARSHEAGVELMKFRLNSGRHTAVIPGSNTAAREFLLNHSFSEFQSSPRMIYGTEIPWHPAMIYNRAAGYCG